MASSRVSIALLDFDGCLTLAPGIVTVNTPVYSVVLKGAKPKYYYEASLISRDEIVKALKNGKENPRNTKVYFAPGVVEFMKKLIASFTEVHIISKNHRAYIQAMFVFYGFSPREIEKINIRDVTDMMRYGDVPSQREIVKDICRKFANAKDVTILLCDDDKNGFDFMQEGIEASGLKPATLIANHAEPGNFDFPAMQERIFPGVATSPVSSPAVSLAPQSEPPVIPSASRLEETKQPAGPAVTIAPSVSVSAPAKIAIASTVFPPPAASSPRAEAKEARGIHGVGEEVFPQLKLLLIEILSEMKSDFSTRHAKPSMWSSTAKIKFKSDTFNILLDWITNKPATRCDLGFAFAVAKTLCAFSVGAKAATTRNKFNTSTKDIPFPPFPEVTLAEVKTIHTLSDMETLLQAKIESMRAELRK